MTCVAKEVILTREAYDNLIEELERLKVQGRQEMKEKIQIALSFGDLSENAEYDEARNDQGKLEERIRELEEMKANAKIIEQSASGGDRVEIGSKVKLKLVGTNRTFVYHLVNSSSSLGKNDDSAIIISDESPVARALLDNETKKGDVIEVEAPRGTVKYKIVDIL